MEGQLPIDFPCLQSLSQYASALCKQRVWWEGNAVAKDLQDRLQKCCYARSKVSAVHLERDKHCCRHWRQSENPVGRYISGHFASTWKLVIVAIIVHSRKFEGRSWQARSSLSLFGFTVSGNAPNRRVQHQNQEVRSSNILARREDLPKIFSDSGSNPDNRFSSVRGISFFFDEISPSFTNWLTSWGGRGRLKCLHPGLEKGEFRLVRLPPRSMDQLASMQTQLVARLRGVVTELGHSEPTVLFAQVICRTGLRPSVLVAPPRGK